MLRIYEALALDAFREFRLVAGEEGLKNEITNVTMLDYETEFSDYSTFHKGDFILSSLYFAKDNPSRIVDAFKGLASIGISGFAIKTIYYSQLPEELKQLADEAHIPVFLFDTTFMEDIIVSADALRKEKARQEINEDILEHILEGPRTEEDVVEKAGALDRAFRPYCSVLYAVRTQQHPFRPLPSKQTIQGIPMSDKTVKFSIFSYHEGLLLIMSANRQEEADNPDRLLRQLSLLHMDEGTCHIGVSESALTYERLDICLEQSLFACHMARLWDRSLVHFKELGAFQYLLPLMHSRTAMDSSRRQLDKIRSYDSANSTAILETLIAYVHNHGNVDKTAEALYQHPNTVRYRVKKASQLLGDPTDFQQQAFIIVHLHLLAQNLRIMPE